DERGVLHRHDPRRVERAPDRRQLQRSSPPRDRSHRRWNRRHPRDVPRDGAGWDPRCGDGPRRNVVAHHAVRNLPAGPRPREFHHRIFSTRPIVDSQRRLKALVEKDMKGDEKYRVGEPRLRVLAIESGLVNLEIRCRDTPEMRSLVKCPVCGERLKKVRNMTVYGGTVTLGYRCERCKYWTGLRRRVPTRYVFTRRS